MIMLAMQKNIDEKERALKGRLTDDEFQAFNDARDPVSSIDAISAMVRWFNQQDDVIRKEILGILPKEYRRDIARLMLERMAAAEEDPDDIPVEVIGGPGNQPSADAQPESPPKRKRANRSDTAR